MIHQGIQQWSPSASMVNTSCRPWVHEEAQFKNRGRGALVGGKVYLQKDDNISIVVGQVGTAPPGRVEEEGVEVSLWSMESR